MIRKGVFFVVVFSVGALAGYSLKPQVKVVICDPASCEAESDEFQRELRSRGDEIAARSPESALTVAQAKRLLPLVKAGPFHLSFNPSNGDYLILQFVEQQPIIEQTTDSDETSLSFTGKGLSPTLNCWYDKSTGKLLSAVYTTYGIGGIFGQTKFTYIDSNGDGRFDKLVDHETGSRYEEKGTQWIKTGSFDPATKRRGTKGRGGGQIGQIWDKSKSNPNLGTQFQIWGHSK